MADGGADLFLFSSRRRLKKQPQTRLKKSRVKYFRIYISVIERRLLSEATLGENGGKNGKLSQIVEFMYVSGNLIPLFLIKLPELVIPFLLLQQK